MKIYISIPISGWPIDEQQAKAAEIAEKIKALGHEPVNPFDTPGPPEKLPDKERYAYFIGEDIKRLMLCDAILLCEWWHTSRGCCAELCIARTYGMVEFPTLRALYRYTRMGK